MIDWVTAIFPYTHTAPVSGGDIVSLDFNGVEEWHIKKRRKVRGSYESNLEVRTVSDSFNPATGCFTQISVDGNFIKFHQGHNLFGTDDLTGLCSETYLKLVNILSLTPTDFDYHAVFNGHYLLKRVDCTMMIELGSLPRVEAFLYSAEFCAHMRHRGKAHNDKGTLYFGKNSRRWALKMYAKGKEIQAKGHKLPMEIDTPSMQNWAAGKLRTELVIRALELKDRGLHIAANWGDNTPVESLYDCLEGLNMSEKHTIPPELLENLSPRLILAYNSWLDGHDLKAILPARTFYTYRKKLQEYGIDIAIRQGNREQKAANIVDFQLVLRPKACEQVPAWAIGTPLYFEPRAKFNVG